MAVAMFDSIERHNAAQRRARQLMRFLAAREARGHRDPARIRRCIAGWDDPDLAELVDDELARLGRLARALERLALQPADSDCGLASELQHFEGVVELAPPAPPAHALTLTETLHVAACAPNDVVPSSLAA
jgi:hypothetical protein